jgi:hypothetical protein
VGFWALKQPLCSHLHKITNEPVFYMALAPYDFDTGQRHYLGMGNWWAGPENLDFFGAKWHWLSLVRFQGLPLPIAHVMSLPRIKIITARAI